MGKGLDDEVVGEVTDNLIFQYTFARREKDEQIMVDVFLMDLYPHSFCICKLNEVFCFRRLI